MHRYSSNKAGKDTLTRQELLTLLEVMKEKDAREQSEQIAIPSMRTRNLISRHLLDKTESFGFNYATYFVALRYYDRIASKFMNDVSVQERVGLMCLLVASKYEEVEEMLPPFSHFYGNPSGIYTNLDQMLNYERFVIEELHWDFGHSCVIHYLDIMKGVGLLFNDDLHLEKPCTPNTGRHLQEYVDFFVKLSFHEPHFSLFRPLQQAGAVIMAARQAVHITPVWREELTGLVGVQYEDFCTCYEYLWNIFCTKYPDVPKSTIKPSPTNVFSS